MTKPDVLSVFLNTSISLGYKLGKSCGGGDWLFWYQSVFFFVFFNYVG